MVPAVNQNRGEKIYEADRITLMIKSNKAEPVNKKTRGGLLEKFSFLSP